MRVVHIIFICNEHSLEVINNIQLNWNVSVKIVMLIRISNVRWRWIFELFWKRMSCHVICKQMFEIYIQQCSSLTSDFYRICINPCRLFASNKLKNYDAIFRISSLRKVNGKDKPKLLMEFAFLFKSGSYFAFHSKTSII